MSVVRSIPPAPVGQQGPPARAAAFDSGGHSAARAGPSYWLQGRALIALPLEPKIGFHCSEVDTEALSVNP
jgi:hypothetical protein